MNVLIPAKYRYLFAAVDSVAVDSAEGIACLVVIIQANQLLDSLPDAIENGFDLAIWEAVAFQCEQLIGDRQCI